MAVLFVNEARRYAKINRNIYGHFTEHLGNCIYGGIYVGEDSAIANVRGIRSDVVGALKNIRVPIVRWPGGCFAEYYNWLDGIGPKENRKCIVNTSWGGVTEDNAFGTHEFLDFCEQVGCEPYITGNICAGNPRELSDWLDYVNFAGKSPMSDLRRANGREEPWKVSYVGIGNENWGGGGNMRPEYYADLFRQFASYIRRNNRGLYTVACGANGADYEWTEKLMQLVGRRMNGLALHFYTMPEYYRNIERWPWEKKGPATGFDLGNYYRTLTRTLDMDPLIERTQAIMDIYDPERKVDLVVDEWGAWHLPEPGTNPGFLFQQNTMRDAIVAAVNLNIFNKYSERVTMANLAQMVNVIQSVVLTKGPEMVLTPTYHVFDLYKGHQDATRIESHVQQDLVGTEETQVPALHASASVDAQGTVHVTVANLCATEAQNIRGVLEGRKFDSIKVRYIAGDMNDYNAFGEAEKIFVRDMPDVSLTGDGFEMQMPACSVAEIILE